MAASIGPTFIPPILESFNPLDVYCAVFYHFKKELLLPRSGQ
jgi:hypothetical protein